MTRFGKYFYGNEISEYGQENGFVDYRTFAKAFDAVLNNEIMSKTYDIGYWEQESGFIDHSEEIEEIEEQIEGIEEQIEETSDFLFNLDDESNAATYEDKIEELEEQKRILEEKKEELEREQDEQPEIFQYFIIDDNGARICEEFNEIVFYNSELDMYIWGVTHWGTSWDYVLTDIPCEKATN